MKTASPALISLLATRQFFTADLYQFSLSGGGQLNYCGGDQDIIWNGITWTAGGTTGPYFDRQDNKAKCHWKIGVAVDTLVFDVLPGTSTVYGDPFLQAIIQGVFDGAEMTLYRAFMPTYGNVAAGTVIMFAGRVAEIDASGSLATFSVNSHLELLNQNMPRNLANTAWIVIGTIDETNGLFVPANSAFTKPQGRLTLTSNTPVMDADATAQTSIYYTPYTGATLPVYNGSYFENYTFSQLTLSLNTTNHVSGNLYDVFIFLNSGTLTIAAGPAWTNSATRSVALTQVNGLWVNNASITLTNGATSYSGIGANLATYVGTFYATANGQTGMSLHPTATNGGTANILGVCNAYNRVKMQAECADSTSSWTYSTNTRRPADNSTSNRISWVDGLQQSSIDASYSCAGNSSSNSSVSASIAIGLNSTTTAASGCGGASISMVYPANLISTYSGYPQLGFNYVQALENNPTGTGTATFGNFTGDGLQYVILKLLIDM